MAQRTGRETGRRRRIAVVVIVVGARSFGVFGRQAFNVGIPGSSPTVAVIPGMQMD